MKTKKMKTKKLLTEKEIRERLMELIRLRVERINYLAAGRSVTPAIPGEPTEEIIQQQQKS